MGLAVSAQSDFGSSAASRSPSLTKVNTDAPEKSFGEFPADPWAFYRLFRDQWPEFIRRNFRNSTDAAAFFGVDDRTARAGGGLRRRCHAGAVPSDREGRMTISYAERMTPEAAALLLECSEKLGRPEAYFLAARMGLAQSDTAKALGVTREAVRAWAENNGISFLPHLAKVAGSVLAEQLRELSNLGSTSIDAAVMVKRSRARVRDVARKAGLALKRPDVPAPRRDEIALLAAEGMTVAEVARALNMNPACVSQAKARHGIVFLRDGRSSK